MEQSSIKPVGPVDAKIVIVGEAPGETEIKEGVPFAGMAGRILDQCLEEAGIKRNDCFITNIMLTRPEGNDFGKFYVDKFRKTAKPELQEGIRRLHAEIKAINPNIVIALGSEALQALTWEKGISDWRGSVIDGITGHKVLPTYHPAAIGREWTFRPAVVCDLKRALKESQYPEIRMEKRDLLVAYNYDEAIRNLQDIKENAAHVAFDIETESEQITCIGFAPSHRPNWAVCIPFWFGSSGSLFSPDQELVLWGHIRDILESESIAKYAQNGSFDIEVLQRTMGFNIRAFVLDTMLGFHCLYAELPKALSFLVSLYTDHPYYKHQIKSPSMDTYFRYNATDACLTQEIACKIYEELVQEGKWEFYQKSVHALVEPLLYMQKTGVRFNWLRKNTIKKRVQEEIAVLQKNLNRGTGRELNVNSPKQMKEWLYGKTEEGGLGLKEKTKKRKDTGETTVTADDEAIEEAFRETKNDNLKRVLEIRTRQKLLSNYLEVKLDEDKRIRCSYLISGTETGRLSSRTTLRGTGTNLQNIPDGPVKTLFIPDDGKTFINADLSQAEARVVAYVSGDQRLIRVFHEGGDIHKRNAANIFNVSVDAVTDNQRQLAKRVVHASNYGMGPITFSKQCGISAAEAKRLLNQYFATYPGIARWQLETAAKVKREKRLTTPMGRTRLFFNRWQDSLVKEAYAFVPQSTVADIVSQGLISLYKRKEEVPGLDILLQVHDSLLVQVPTELLKEGIALVKECMTVPVLISGKEMVIPVDTKTGKNWGEMVK